MSEWTIDVLGNSSARAGGLRNNLKISAWPCCYGRRSHEAHQRICHNGDPPSGVYAVLEGQVNLVAEREPGASLFYNFLEPGSWFGQGNCLDREPFLLDAVAVHRTVVLHFPLYAFDAVLEERPAFIAAGR